MAHNLDDPYFLPAVPMNKLNSKNNENNIWNIATIVICMKQTYDQNEKYEIQRN